MAVVAGSPAPEITFTNAVWNGLGASVQVQPHGRFTVLDDAALTGVSVGIVVNTTGTTVRVDGGSMTVNSGPLYSGTDHLLDICNGGYYQVNGGFVFSQGNQTYTHGTSFLRVLVRDGATFASYTTRRLDLMGRDNVFAVSNASLEVKSGATVGPELSGVENAFLFHNAKVGPVPGDTGVGGFFFDGTNDLMLVTGADSDIRLGTGTLGGTSNLIRVAECAKFSSTNGLDFAGKGNVFRVESDAEDVVVYQFRWAVNKTYTEDASLQVGPGAVLTHIKPSTDVNYNMKGTNSNVVIDNGTFVQVGGWGFGEVPASRSCAMEFRGESPRFSCDGVFNAGCSTADTASELRFFLSGSGYTNAPITANGWVALQPGTIIRVDDRRYRSADGRSHDIPLLSTSARSITTDMVRLNEDADLPVGAFLSLSADMKLLSVLLPPKSTTCIILR